MLNVVSLVQFSNDLDYVESCNNEYRGAADPHHAFDSKVSDVLVDAGPARFPGRLFWFNDRTR